MTVTQERLKELLHYDPETGVFIRRTSVNNCYKAGEIAGSVNTLGYIVLGVDRRFYKAHRLAWLYMTGDWPASQVDHINRVKNDNRWVNLRAATNAQNMQNKAKRSDNTSGFVGVVWVPRLNKWAARITVGGRTIQLGCFDSPFAAHDARVAAAAIHHTHGPTAGETSLVSTMS